MEGAVYGISELDMLTGIEKKLISFNETGQLRKAQNAMMTRTLEHILRPKAVFGVSDLLKGQKAASHFFDPSVILNKDILNTQGERIARKGQRLNPLDQMHFDETLIFINGDNSAQIDWVGQYKRERERKGGRSISDKRLKIILVNGNIKTTSEKLKSPVYFDQYGSLCHTFHIRHTPTRVFQPGETEKEGENEINKKTEKGMERKKRLLVQEVMLD